LLTSMAISNGSEPHTIRGGGFSARVTIQRLVSRTVAGPNRKG
jgi:hypothetical protein